MNQARSKNSNRTGPSPAETESVEKYGAALFRVLDAAKRAGAKTDDIGRAKLWPLLWATEVTRRHELEPLADIGRKVSSGRANEDPSRRNQEYADILSCACRLLLDGARPRGLATKIRNELKISLSTRQINRILNQWMPKILSK